MIFALAGNQNCGKTTLFNQLTGSNQHVGNFPGVTVERKEGVVTRAGRRAIPRLWHRMRQEERHRAFHEAARDNALREARDAMREAHEDRRRLGEIRVVDLPGIYSLSPYTNEEIVTRDFLLDSHPDGIINIVDATNIERNLYLTLQLIELHIPMVVALNMMDEFRANGGTIKIKKLSEELGVPVVPISAVKNEGIDELIHAAAATAAARQLPARLDFCSGAVHRCIHAVAHLVEDHAERIGVPPRFAATKLVEGDAPMMERLALSENEKDMVEHSVTEMEQELGTDREAALADMRYCFIDDLVRTAVVKPGESREHVRSVRMDAVLTHKYFAIPIFLVIMLLIFWLTFCRRASTPSPPPSRRRSAPTGSTPSSTRWSSTASSRGSGACSPSCRSSSCSSFSSRCSRTAAIWRASPSSWTSCCARSVFRAAPSCRCSSASAARCPPSWRPAPSRASGTAA